MSALNLEKQIEKLEIKLTYQEDLLNQLNDVVSSQAILLQKLSKRIDFLENELAKVNKESLIKGEDGVSFEIPPHY